MIALTDEQWRDTLEAALEARQPKIKLTTDYYDGRHRLQFATSKFREAFGELFSAFATNWCGLVVDIAVERLTILGFRFGEDDADGEAWRIWQANDLDANSIIAHTESVKCGTSYLMVGPPREPGGEPVITIEHPSQVITIHDPSDRRIRLAGLKKYRDIDGTIWTILYLPDSVTTWRKDGHVERASVLGIELPVAPGRNEYEEVATSFNPLGRVPIIPLENNPNLLTGGTSDLDPAIALNDAANKFFTDMIHSSEYTSFPQRVLTGVELPRDPITGDVVNEVQLRAAVSRLWAFEDPAAGVHDLSVGSLTNYVEGVDLAVQHLAAQTRTPPHYLLAKLANLSGDALKAAETGLVARCTRKQVDYDDSWEETMRLAFMWRSIDRRGWPGSDQDAARAEMTDAETIWKNPESRDPSTVADELVKKAAIGVPEEILWEEANYTPQQIARMTRMKADRIAQQQKLAETAAQAGGDVQGEATIQQTAAGLEVKGLPTPPPEPAAAANGAGG